MKRFCLSWESRALWRRLTNDRILSFVTRTGFILTVLAMATTMAVAAPPILLFADDFESGGFAAWAEEFPLGFYSVPTADLDQLPDLGASVAANPFWSQGSSSSPPFLAACEENGQKSIVGFEEHKALAQNVEQYVEGYLSTIKNHPALLAYYLPDEPMSRNLSVSRLRALYDEIKKNDSEHPVILTDYVGADRAKGTYDIFAYDAYPIGSMSIQQYRTEIRDAVSEASPQAVWVVLQAFAEGSQWIEPTPEELRAMAYVALLNGAQGLLTYQWSYVATRPSMLDTLGELFQELSDVSAALPLVEVSSSLSVSTARPGLDLAIDSDSGSTLLFAVNWKSQVNYLAGHDPGVALYDVEIDVSGVPDGYFEVIAGDGLGDRIDVIAGRMADDFGPYATKIYRWSPLP